MIQVKYLLISHFKLFNNYLILPFIKNKSKFAQLMRWVLFIYFTQIIKFGVNLVQDTNHFPELINNLIL